MLSPLLVSTCLVTVIIVGYFHQEVVSPINRVRVVIAGPIYYRESNGGNNRGNSHLRYSGNRGSRQ